MSALLAALLLFAQLGETPNDYARDAARVGLAVDKRNGAIVVTAVDDGSSAAKLGIHVGDEILRIDLENAREMSESAAGGSLRGMVGTHVNLTLLPRGAMVPRTVSVERDVKVYMPGGSQLTFDDAQSLTAPRTHGTIDVKVTSFEVTSGPDADTLQPLFGSGTPDVGTCVGALGELLPNDLATLGATFTFRREGSISVRTEPPSADLASCLGRRSVGWKIPKAGKTPTVVKVTWSITRTP
jgi:hypothetical protein